MSESRDRPDDSTTPAGDDSADRGDRGDSADSADNADEEQANSAASGDPYDIESDFGPDGNPVNSAE
ncbi:MAG: hypothetical protein EPO52_00080 [Herbiconiux sp.]|uniref:hypothetical protein n=1 Tax=Herbiconiux sp. TaxID=1871186 RepID=UPI0012167B35|nr:hypothetical protein [Herbiconiux sp.]TAJ50260.1 MAG: hypothetical protein EPO52_00080 [Herbiconiux sp.]